MRCLALIAVVALLAGACGDAVSPQRLAPGAAETSTTASAATDTARIVGVGSLGLGPTIPGGDRRDFDFDVVSTLSGRLFYRDWSVVRVDGTAGTLTVDTDPRTGITAFRNASAECTDPGRGVEFEGTGRVNTGGDTNPAGDEWLVFTVVACDEGPAESGADVLAFSVPAHGYAAGPDRLTSGDLVKSSSGGSPNQPPTAGFTQRCNGLTCKFTSTSSDPDGSISSYSWTFGDGATSTAQNPSHHYTAEGTYTVTLTVTDNQGATNSASDSVTVSRRS